jgi:predicted ATP-dependent serine protease
VRSLGEKSLTEELREDAVSLPGLDELDHMQRPEDDFCILDADATQRLCIEAAKRGQSFVMQGPPGTGKSQTIANMLADGIARGKRVLFVGGQSPSARWSAHRAGRCRGDVSAPG